MCRSQSRSPLRRGVVASCALVLAVTLGSCSDEAQREPGGQTWSTGTALDPSGLIWGSGHVVRLADGAEIDTEHDFEEYAVAGDSVWFTRAEDAETDDWGRLYRATRDGVERTDAVVAELLATADGRYLLFLDRANGPEDGAGGRAYLLVVIDTETGKETIRTAEGMDETPPGGGIAEAYEDGDPSIVAVADGKAYVEAIGELHSFELATGEHDALGSQEPPGNDEDEPEWNSAHTWQIQPSNDFRPTFVDENGRRVTPRAGSEAWTLSRWLDDDTAVGLAMPEGEERGVPGDQFTLITCEVPSGACTPVPDSTYNPHVDPSPLPRRADEGGGR